MRGCSLAALIALCAGAAEARPQRIVSLNPCIDSVLLRVADAPQVAAISHWSHDPSATSVPLELARRYPAHGGTAEEVIRLKPDLVLLTPFTPGPTRAALARLRIPMVEVGVPSTIGESLAQVKVVADAAGHPARGQALVRAIWAELEAARRPGARPALMRMHSSFVPGPGSLSEALMAHAGLVSLSSAYGAERATVLPLEALALKPPPLIITDRPEKLHPVLARQGVRAAGFERRLLNCGGPSLGPAARALAAIRDGAR